VSPLTIVGQNEVTKSLLEQVNPVEPTSSSLGQYGVYPVNYSTGLVPISIPLYEVKSGELTLPIELVYHGGGIKVTQEASWVGLGWDLNFGGVITRTMNGFPDELETGQVPNAATIQKDMKTNYNKIGNMFDYMDLANADREEISFKPDIFSYNIGSNSGTFYLNNNDSIIPINYNTIKGTLTNMIATDGTKYRFNASEGISINSKFEKKSYTCTYYVDRILSANNNDSIKFSYQSDGGFHPDTRTYREGYETYDSQSLTSGSSGTYIAPKYINTHDDLISDRTVGSVKPQYIYFNGGRLVFNILERDDIKIPLQKLHKLDNITIEKSENSIYTPIKKIQFYYSYFNKNSNVVYHRLCLDSVVEFHGSDLLSGRKLISKFDYYGNKIMPAKDSYDSDYWGYYNGKNNTSYIPKTKYCNYEIGSADKTPDENYAVCGTLKTIEYPTKGKTEFIWEGNRINTNPYSPYNYSAADLVKYEYNYPFAGLRIKGINNYDNNGMLLKKKIYKYEVSGYSSGIITNPNSGKISFSKRRTGYDERSTSGGIAILTTHSFLVYSNLISGASANDFMYINVQEYNVDANNMELNGYTNYQFSTYNDEYSYDGVPVINKGHLRGQLINKSEYIKNSTSGYSLLKETRNYYSKDTRIKYSKQGFVMLWNYNFTEPNVILQLGYYQSDVLQPVNFCYSSDWVHLDSTTVKDYVTPSTVVKGKTEYKYTSVVHLQPTEITSPTSTGDIIKVITRYPSDINTGIYASMTIKNMLTYPIDIKKYYVKTGQADKLIDGTLNTYTLDDHQHIMLTNVSEYLPSGSLSNLYNYKYNEKGRLVQAIGKDNIPTSIYWDSYGMYPLIVAMNMSYSDLLNVVSSNYSPYLFSTSSCMNAQVTTFTYKPLVGMTSVTDPKGVTTYFSYDSFGRLRDEKNQNNSILKEYRYHYFNQPPE
jgi:YD repeat-containing protein